jgi:hypothetical protein
VQFTKYPTGRFPAGTAASIRSMASGNGVPSSTHPSGPVQKLMMKGFPAPDMSRAIPAASATDGIV